MSWRRSRQITFVTAALLTLVIMGFVLFLILRQPVSCGDGRQNQDEMGVDCGGSCSAVCPNESRPLIPLWSRPFKVGEGNYDLGAVISNPNAALAAEIDYVFLIYDRRNLLLGERAGTSFVNPDEKLVLFEHDILTGERPAVRATLGVTAARWVRRENPSVTLTVRNKQLVSTTTPRVAATIVNESLFDLINIQVFAVVSQAQGGNAVGLSSTRVEFIPRGGSADITFTWGQPFEGSGDYIVEILPHIDYEALR